MAEILPLSNGNLAKATLAAQEWLIETFAVFRPMPMPDWPNPMPLALGIYETILSIAPENISPAGVKNFLIQYTSTPEYHQSVYESTARFDLNAKPTTKITEEERDYARHQLGIQGYVRLPDEPEPDEA
jgi:sRNA-binding protein